MEYSIRYAQKSDMEMIMRFIDEHWKNGHILSRNKRLFEWQYGAFSDRLNVIIGIDKENKMQGMLGFIPYDSDTNKDIALALWKANPSTGFLGIKMLLYLLKNEQHREVICTGITPDTTKKIYEQIGMSTGLMEHWYRLVKKDSYAIAKVADSVISDYQEHNKQISFVQIKCFEELETFLSKYKYDENSEGVPFKSLAYIRKRYFEHPVYNYIIYLIENETDATMTVVILRLQRFKESGALRLIDCIGDISNLKYVTRELDRIVNENGAEYVDCYETGVSEEIMKSAGWENTREHENIIPDYFSPFELRNVNIYYSTSSSRAVLFKGDGDQDRPN